MPEDGRIAGREIAALDGAEAFAGAETRDYRGVTIDSRAVPPGSLFVALPGARVDGHEFVEAAIQAGAGAALVRHGARVPEGVPRFAVPDPLVALQELARARRKRLRLDVVAITGSNGKTTTKDLTHAVLEATRPTLKTEGNKNNEIGLPLTLLRLTDGHRAAVVEMGMNHFGEIAFLAAMARPTVGVITNIGEAHLEGVGSREGVARAKSEMAEALGPSDTLVYDGDEPLLEALHRNRPYRTIRFGESKGLEMRATSIESRGADGVEMTVEGRGRFTIPLPGRHNARNALAAIAVGEALGVPADTARSALASAQSAPMRGAVESVSGITILDDTYNANPDSMRAAIALVKELAGKGRAYAALGDMLEMGAASTATHVALGRTASGLDGLYLVGPMAAAVVRGAEEGGMAHGRARVFAEKSALADELAHALRPGDAVLVKGSRGMGMETVVRRLREIVAGAGSRS